jgi:hypothetical protein
LGTSGEFGLPRNFNPEAEGDNRRTVTGDGKLITGYSPVVNFLGRRERRVTAIIPVRKRFNADARLDMQSLVASRKSLRQ